MRYLIRLIVVALVVVQGAAAVNLTRFERHRIAGVREFSRDRWLEASREFEAARKISASDSQIWAWAGVVGLSYYETHIDDRENPRERDAALDRAWRGYAGAVLRCPLDAFSWCGLAEVARRKALLQDIEGGIDLSRIERRSTGILDAMYAVALAAAKTGIHLKPAGFEQLDALAAIYEATGEVDLAQEFYVRSAKMMPAPAFHAWGVQRLVAPLYKAVLKGLEEGLAKAPFFEKSLLHREVGKFALEQDDTATAVVHLRQAESTANNAYERFTALWELATAQEAVGKSEDAIASLKRARDAGYPRGPVGRRIGVLQLQLGRAAEACPELRESLRETPGDQGLRMQAAVACEQGGEIDLAERTLREGFVVPTDSLPLARALVDFYRRIGRNSTAVTLVRTWARDNPGNKDLERWAEEAAEREP